MFKYIVTVRLIAQISLGVRLKTRLKIIKYTQPAFLVETLHQELNEDLVH